MLSLLVSIGLVAFAVILSIYLSKKNNAEKKETTSPVFINNTELKFYISLDNEEYGPFTLSELKADYPILEDTMITTNTLNGEWYEARYFECFDELFYRQQEFRINEFGEIVRN